jgi:hypothetical protein
MENKELTIKPELEIVRFAPGDFFHKSLDENELPGVPV